MESGKCHNTNTYKILSHKRVGDLVVQQPSLHASNASGVGSSLVGELRSHMLQAMAK